MALDPRLLEILRCPVTGQSLSLASRRQLESINQALSAEAAPANITPQAIESALMVADGSRAYRIDDGIPVLLASESISLGADG